MKEDLDDVFNYDIDKMDKALSSGTITLPKGMSNTERREYIRNYFRGLNESTSKNGNEYLESLDEKQI